MACRNKSNMLKGNEKKEDYAAAAADNNHGSAAGNGEANGGGERVFRHGPEAARICDAALTVTGPDDPLMKAIVNNDDDAQMAYHVHKALGFALDLYKNKNNRKQQQQQLPSPGFNPPPRRQHIPSADVFIGMQPQQQQQQRQQQQQQQHQQVPGGNLFFDEGPFPNRSIAAIQTVRMNPAYFGNNGVVARGNQGIKRPATEAAGGQSTSKKKKRKKRAPKRKNPV